MTRLLVKLGPVHFSIKRSVGLKIFDTCSVFFNYYFYVHLSENFPGLFSSSLFFKKRPVSSVCRTAHCAWHFFSHLLTSQKGIDYKQSLFFLKSVKRNARDTQMTMHKTKALDGRGTKKEKLPPKPERIVFHSLVIFWQKKQKVN